MGLQRVRDNLVTENGLLVYNSEVILSVGNLEEDTSVFNFSDAKCLPVIWPGKSGLLTVVAVL